MTVPVTRSGYVLFDGLKQLACPWRLIVNVLAAISTFPSAHRADVRELSSGILVRQSREPRGMGGRGRYVGPI